MEWNHQVEIDGTAAKVDQLVKGPYKIQYIETVPSNFYLVSLLMLQKSCDHQLRLALYPIIYRVFLHPRWLLGISSINSRIHVAGIFTYTNDWFLDVLMGN